MAGLTVKGDPYAWLDAGRAISTLMMQLESELPYAGGPVVGEWHGPAASAFTADWTSRRSRYEDLIGHARTAAKAITDYGEKLYDLVQQAANLESTWCGVGLHVMETGADFMLPPGFDLLPAETQLSLHQALAESRTAVEKMASDALGAVEDLTVALRAAIAALEDFQLIEVGVLGVVGSAAARYLVSRLREPLEDGHMLLENAHGLLDAAKEHFDIAADNASTFASQMSSDLREGSPGEQSAGGMLLKDAGLKAQRATATAGYVDKLQEFGTPIALLAANGLTVGEVVYDARRQGLRASLEEHAGDIAATATGDVLEYFAPDCPLDGVVAVGVGFTVQAVVDHRKAIGHFAERVVADL